MSPSRIKWTHTTTTESVDAVAARAFRIAKMQMWKDQTMSAGVALQRAWLAGICAQIAGLGTTPPARIQTAEGSFAASITPVSSPDPVRGDFQRMLAAALVGVAGGTHVTPDELATGYGTDDKPLVFLTTDGDAAHIASTAQIGVWEAVVIVGASVALAGACAWIAGEASELIQNALQIDANRANLAQVTTTTAEIVEAHRAQETAAGHEIAFNDEERKTLDTLRGAIKTAVAWEPPALQSVPKMPSSGDVGKGFGGVIGVALLAVAAYYLTKKDHGRERLAA